MAGFNGYSDLISKITNSTLPKKLILPFTKIASTAPVAGVWYHLWPVGGSPGPGAYTGTALQHNRTIDTTAGALYHGGNKSSETKHLIGSTAMANGGATLPVLMLVDQVGYYPITPSGALQSFDVTNTLPDRYVAAGQCGLQAFLVQTGALDATACTISSLNYVNQDGNAKAMPTTPTVTVVTSLAAPTVNLGARGALSTPSVVNPFIPLAAGDIGMRKLTDVTFSAVKTAMAFVMVKPLALMPFPLAGVHAERDFVLQLANLERIYDGACLSFLVYFTTTTGANLTGDLQVAWG